MALGRLATDTSDDVQGVARTRVLVTTRLSSVGFEHRAVLMAGPWCLESPDDALRPHAMRSNVEVLPYHWDDRGKLARDYEYLQGLHHRLLDRLAATLNAYHGKAASRRFWQLLVDPWLLSYLGVQFDRWEVLRLALSSGERFDTSGVPDRVAPPFGYVDFCDQTMSDEWNLALFGRIVSFQYAAQVSFRPIDGPSSAQSSAAPAPPRSAGKASVIRWLDRALAPLSRVNSVVLVDSYFSRSALAKLSFRMALVPRLYRTEFDAMAIDRVLRNRLGVRDETRLRVDFEPTNDFEKYLAARLPVDLPTSVVEHRPALEREARAIRLRPKVIVTALAHWTNALTKAWIAERVEAGTKLLIHNHGGSIPSRREFFDFESDIADLRATWFRLSLPKHQQLPPSKLVGARNGGRLPHFDEAGARYLLVVANEYPRWTIRVHFCPMADQGLRSYAQTIEMIETLDPAVREAVRVRPAEPLGWGLDRSYARVLGASKVDKSGSLSDAFKQARFIVCTYPETTFCESLATARPTILMYPDEVYERHPSAADVIAELRAAQILFHDPRAAAAHISSVWSDIDSWWNRSDVLAARSSFMQTAMRLDGDWLGEWSRVLASLSRSAGSSARTPM